MFCSVLNTALMFGDRVSLRPEQINQTQTPLKVKGVSRELRETLIMPSVETWAQRCYPSRPGRGVLLLSLWIWCWFVTFPSGAVNGDLFLRWLWYMFVCHLEAKDRDAIVRSLKGRSHWQRFTAKPRFSFA